MENGYNFWVGNYSGVSRTGKVIPSGKMTKVSTVYNNNIEISFEYIANYQIMIKSKNLISKAMQSNTLSWFSI